MERICEVCGRQADEEMLEVDGQRSVCVECATRMAHEAQDENRGIEICDEAGERWVLCQWCGELYPEGSLREEVDIGPLCGWCIAAIHSRGESLTLRC